MGRITERECIGEPIRINSMKYKNVFLTKQTIKKKLESKKFEIVTMGYQEVYIEASSRTLCKGAAHCLKLKNRRGEDSVGVKWSEKS